MTLRDTIIYLIGVPAVGKYTTAKAIARLSGAIVVDNQLINNPVFSVVGYDGTDAVPLPARVWTHTDTIRGAVLAAIRECGPPGASYVLTNVLEATPEDEALFRTIEDLAVARGATFVPVWLTCDAATIRLRKDAPDRRTRLKDVDLTTIDWWLHEFELLRVVHPNALELDTSTGTADATARRILTHVAAVAPGAAGPDGRHSPE